MGGNFRVEVSTSVSAQGVVKTTAQSRHQIWVAQDLLKEHDVPAIPGVTSPMTYIGMWKVRCPPLVNVFTMHLLV